MINNSLSIIITSRNRYSDLLLCLQSIFNSNLGDLNYELIIIDDCSTDETRLLSSDFFNHKNIHIYHNSTQLMMVQSRNLGASLSSGSFLLYIDDDNEVHQDMIINLYKFMLINKDFGIVGPQMAYYDTKDIYMNFQSINLATGKTKSGIIHNEKGYNICDGIPNVFMIRRSIFQDINFFDPLIVQTYTEPDLSYKARLKGSESCILDSALTFHKIPSRFSSAILGGNAFTQKAYFLIRNRIVIVCRYGSFFEIYIFLIFFSWFWPFVYSLLVFRELRFDLVRLYWLGFYDGITYLFTKNLPQPHLVIGRVQKIINKEF
jgi:glycosyltransferase involved in cell wall biosynthesis